MSKRANDKLMQANALYQYGRDCLRRKDLPRAVANFSGVIELQPQHRKIYKVFYHRARALDALGLHEQAIADFSSVIRLQPNFLKAYYHRGLVFFWGRHDLAAAIHDFSMVLEMDPHNLDALLVRGLAHSRQGEAGKAIRDYFQVIRLNPAFFEQWRQDLHTAYVPDIPGLPGALPAGSVTLADAPLSATLSGRPIMNSTTVR